MSSTDGSSNTTKLQHEEPPHKRRAAEDLKRSGLTLKEAMDAGAWPMSPLDTNRHTQEGMNFSSLYFQYRGFDTNSRLTYTNSAGESMDFCRVRMYPDDPDVLKFRYWQPPKSGCALFIPQSVDWDKVLKDPSIPVYVTEGEKKAIKATLEGFITVSVGGVNNIVKQQGLLPELALLAKGGRLMPVVFDGDQAVNSNVRDALGKLSNLLAEAGANVGTINLPTDSKLDDYLVDKGAEEFADLPIKPWDIGRSLAAVRDGKLTAYKKKKMVSSLIRGHMLEHGKFYHGRLNETFYFSADETVLLKLDDLKASRLRSFLCHHYGTNASEPEYKFVMEDIQTYCLRHGAATEVHIYSHWDAAAGVLYISAGAHKMFRIDKSGHTVVDNGTDDVLMSNCEGPLLELAEHNEEGVDYFGQPFTLPNYADPSIEPLAVLALKAYTLTLLFPEASPTKVIPLFCGPKGSFKTTSARALVQLFLGGDHDVLSADENVAKDIWTYVDKYPLGALDNVDGNIKGLANVIATISTGGVKTKRKLYSDTEEVAVTIRAGMMATSRNPKSFGRGDVVDRLLVFACARLGHGYRPESVMKAETMELRPHWWRQVIELLPGVIRALQDAPRTRTFKWRMADYANMAYLSAEVLGYAEADVDALVAWQTKERNKFAAEHGSLVGLLKAYYEKYTEDDKLGAFPAPDDWFKAKALYEMLKEVYTGRVFPFESPTSLGRSLYEDWETIEAECEWFVRKEDKVNGGWKFKWCWQT